jgi:uncharacterized membrane protein
MDVSWSEGALVIVHVAMGIGLAACAGLRAFLPLLVVGVAGRMGWVPVSESFSWLEGTPALIVFSVAVVFELLADKLPVIDNFLDVFQTIVKPIAGAFVMATVVTDWTPLYMTVVAVIGGAGVAAGVHLGKAKLRLVSTVTTAGVGNPVLSVTEDVGALAGSVVSIAAPPLVLIVVVVGMLLGWVAIRRADQSIP